MVDEEILTPGDNPETDAPDFSVSRYNKTGYVWETRVPGEDCEATWEDEEHQHATLTSAVNAAIPDWVKYGLTLDTAARLAIDVGLVMHTGMECDETETATEDMTDLEVVEDWLDKHHADDLTAEEDYTEAARIRTKLARGETLTPDEADVVQELREERDDD